LIARGLEIGYDGVIMKIVTPFLLIASMALSACGVPDIIAHGVKSYEKSQEQKDQAVQSQGTQPAASQPQPQQTQPDQPPPVAPPPPRAAVTKQAL